MKWGNIVAKQKEVTFNIFRPSIERYKDGQNISRMRYNFQELIDKFIEASEDEFKVEFKDEVLILQKLRLDEKDLYHIQILKERSYDLPFEVKKSVINEESIEAATQETVEEINYDSMYIEKAVKTSEGSFLGEIMVLLYDSAKNSMIIQSNRNCTTLTGVVHLFTNIYASFFEREDDEEIIINFAPIHNKNQIDKAKNLSTFSEIIMTIEDNDLFKNAESVINKDDTLGAQRIKLHYYIDTNSDRKSSLVPNKVREIISLVSNKNPKIKQLDVKGRETEDGLIEKFELVEGRLYFKHKFTATKGKGTLNPNAILDEMKNKYKNHKIGGSKIRDLT